MPRGRPRKFDEDVVLNAAMLLFWRKGLSAASIDDLADVMQMNKPSIYNAFGGKEAIYRMTLARFCGQLDAGMEETLGSSKSLQDALSAFYRSAIDVYCGNDPSMGCLMICTAPAVALEHPGVGDDLRGLIAKLDRTLARRLKQAQLDGEIADSVDVNLTAKLLQATLQTIALRARAGESKASLRRLAAHASSKLLA